MTDNGNPSRSPTTWAADRPIVTHELIDFYSRRARELRAAAYGAVLARLGDAFRRLLDPITPRNRGDASARGRSGQRAPADRNCRADV